MRLISGPRCSGKTTALIEESAKTGIPIIAPTMMMAEAIKRMAKRYGVDIPEPLSVNKIVNQGRGRPKKYYIDELEMCLRELGIDPVMSSICNDEEEVAK